MKDYTWKKPTVAQEAEAFKNFCIDLEFQGYFVGNKAAAQAMLDRLHQYVEFGGAKTDKIEAQADQDRYEAFWTYIVGNPEAGKKPAKTKAVTK